MKKQVLQTLHETVPHRRLCHHPAVFFHHLPHNVFSVPQEKIRRVSKMLLGKAMAWACSRSMAEIVS
jgi:hypothetical protein